MFMRASSVGIWPMSLFLSRYRYSVGFGEAIRGGKVGTVSEMQNEGMRDNAREEKAAGTFGSQSVPVLWFGHLPILVSFPNSVGISPMREFFDMVSASVWI